MMGALGRFLELSLPSPDVARSLAFYQALGFAELVTGDIRAWHYAVVTDGAIVIGLHGAGIAEPAIAFVRPQLARQVQALAAAGQDFEFARLGADEFHEAGLRTPDGQLILMLEARTFSPGIAGPGPDALFGQCREVTLACRDVAVTQDWFGRAGFLPDAGDEAVERLVAPGITLGLRAGPARPAATLRFHPADRGGVPGQLATLGFTTVPGPEGQVLTAPEGTRLLVGR